MKVIEVPVLRMPGTEDLPLPNYATPGSAGLDLLAAVEAPLELDPFQTALVPTGLCLALPEGYEAQVRPRSGLAARYGVTVLNSPGTIDTDYRGEIKVILVNLGKGSFRIERGERIAQLVVAPVARIQWHPAPALPGTARGGGGFGHTGI